MKHKGKRSPLKTAKKTKANHKMTASANHRGLFKLRNQRVSKSKKTTPSNHRKSLLETFNKNNPQFKQELKTRTIKAKTSKPKHPLCFVIYAVTIIIGISTILGTTVSIADSISNPIPSQQKILGNKQPQNLQNRAKLERLLSFASLGEEINPLKSKLEVLAEKYPSLQPEVFLVDLDTKGYVSVRGKEAISSASTIKLPILVAFFQDVDRHKIQLEEQLTMTKELMVGGSGDMQHSPPGRKYSALETSTKMITISDNTATNMLIERLGGMETLNKRFLAMGLTQTKLRNPLPDLTGTNTTSAEDLGNLLLKIDRGELLSLRSRDRLLHIMNNVEKDTLLPHGLESGALIAHKTGDPQSRAARRTRSLYRPRAD